MKKLLIVFLALLFVFTGCNKQEEPPESSYVRPSMYDEATQYYEGSVSSDTTLHSFEFSIFKSETNILSKGYEKTYPENPQPVSVQCGKKSFAVTKKHSEKRENGQIRHEYEGDDGTTIYITDGIGFIIFPGTSLPSSEPLEGEQDYINLAKSYVAQYLEVDYSLYTYSCSTFYWEHGEDWVSGNTTDEFYADLKPNEEIMSHTICFTRYVNGYATEDEIWVRIRLDGGLAVLRYISTGLDWSTAIFEQSKLEESVTAFLANNIDGKNCGILSHEIESYTLSYFDGEVKMMVEVELELKDLRSNQGEYVTLVQLWFDPPQ